MFLGEILGAVFLVQQSHIDHSITERAISVSSGHMDTDGQTVLHQTNGKLVKVLDHLDVNAYYTEFAELLNTKKQSAVIGSFEEQKRMWNR
jgi:hypothetical protein